MVETPKGRKEIKDFVKITDYFYFNLKVWPMSINVKPLLGGGQFCITLSP